MARTNRVRYITLLPNFQTEKIESGKTKSAIMIGGVFVRVFRRSEWGRRWDEGDGVGRR